MRERWQKSHLLRMTVRVVCVCVFDVLVILRWPSREIENRIRMSRSFSVSGEALGPPHFPESFSELFSEGSQNLSWALLKAFAAQRLRSIAQPQESSSLQAMSLKSITYADSQPSLRVEATVLPQAWNQRFRCTVKGPPKREEHACPVPIPSNPSLLSAHQVCKVCCRHAFQTPALPTKHHRVTAQHTRFQSPWSCEPQDCDLSSPCWSRPVRGVL